MLSEKRISPDEAITLLQGMLQTAGRAHHKTIVRVPARHDVFEAIPPAPRLVPIIRDNSFDIFNPF
jgi:hypothetical protein